MSEALYCAVGGEPITTTWYRHDGHTVCEHHYFERFGKHCVIGGELLKGQYWTNCWGEHYCEAHARGLETCHSCFRHICNRLTGGGVRYADGRAVCNRCRATAIDRSDQGRPIIADACRVLRSSGGLDLGDGSWVRLVLVDRHELLRRTTAAYCREPHGQATYEWRRNGAGGTRDYLIRILSGLPRENFAAMCAHELGHIYMFRHDFPQLSDPVKEGLCELCTFIWLMEQRTPEANRRLREMWRSTDPVYGEGFRMAYRAMYGRSLADLMAHVRRTGRLPQSGMRGY